MRLIQHIIRDKEKLEELEMELIKTGYMNYLMFDIGIKTGLSLSDIVNLKVIDLKDKTHIKIIDKNTKKVKTYLINSLLKQELDHFIKLMTNDEYIFKNDKGENRPISILQASTILNKAAKKVGIEEIDPHTLRKTFGYWHYKENKNLAFLQDMFNYPSPIATLIYIGIYENFKGFFS